MKKVSLCITTLALAASAYAQKSGDPAKYARYISAEDAKKHLSILASDEYEGRETGKPGAEKAANYIANEFKKLGLQPPVNGSYFLNVPLEENKLIPTFSINGQPLGNAQDFYINGFYTDKNIDTKD